eukprot:CAMPEP_0119366664 /NCGR_PEP_ID=MMETSP1334-20130426/13506_1 /TAXON_ID=127549 /ORGANISM="Calcidiscus leptoporus, Strain RCC1130" /LENGTH=87 /DNA_ID=CAMNT_0007382917 /DNA_START=156 /DNA_END=419 /DNA_ORIENTATION=+
MSAVVMSRGRVCALPLPFALDHMFQPSANCDTELPLLSEIRIKHTPHTRHAPSLQKRAPAVRRTWNQTSPQPEQLPSNPSEQLPAAP